MEILWYRQFDRVLLRAESSLTPAEVETRRWLAAFDDAILGSGRCSRRRRWCDSALALQWHLRHTRAWPSTDDSTVPVEMRSWVREQQLERFTEFQTAWWRYLQGLAT
ncbi:hypothetical protein Q9R20_06250 [Microbacterium sp. PRF11]|uniref:hypothetical protein n=1 Tax=Microbacterium sp. PRF11 TaxID=2962593 RepID=UPI00288116DA|nr:hypothetical protein [Microbacterium sp. PRF11]MDT0116588.1 hypothetical protein [Microbacterium sp. PRF11]